MLVYDSAVTTCGSFEPPSGIAFHPGSRLDPEFEEGILHEIGHVLDARMGSVSERAWWKAAREKDQSRHVSDYAETDDAEGLRGVVRRLGGVQARSGAARIGAADYGRATHARPGADQVPDGVVRPGADGRRQHG